MFSCVGYTAEDILSVIMRVTKTYQMSEFMQLEFIRVDDHVFVYLCGRYLFCF